MWLVVGCNSMAETNIAVACHSLTHDGAAACHSLTVTPTTQEKEPTSIAIAPGGLAEARFGRSNKVLLSKRFGFVKLAVETGTHLVPVLGVGEELVGGAYATTLAAALLLPAKRVPVNVSGAQLLACCRRLGDSTHLCIAGGCLLAVLNQPGGSTPSQQQQEQCVLSPIVQLCASSWQQSQTFRPLTTFCSPTDLGLPRTNMSAAAAAAGGVWQAHEARGRGGPGGLPRPLRGSTC